MKFLQSILKIRKAPLLMTMLLTAVCVPSAYAHIDGTHHTLHTIDYSVVVGVLLVVAIGLLIARSKSRF